MIVPADSLYRNATDPHRAFVRLQLRLPGSQDSPDQGSNSSLSHRQRPPEPDLAGVYCGCSLLPGPVKVTPKAGVLESLAAKVLSLRQGLFCHLVVRL